MRKAAGYVATASLVASPFVSSLTIAMPTQGGYTTTPTVNTEPVKLAKASVLIRNTTTPAETTPVSVSTKEHKQDKKAIGRCWKRLITMVREVAYTHHQNRK